MDYPLAIPAKLPVTVLSGFLGAGTVPVPVRGEELEQLKGILTEKSEEYKTDMQVGEYVTIGKGPFEGSE